MTYYSRTRTSTEVSSYSDYGGAEVSATEFTDTPGQFVVGQYITATSAAVAFFNATTFAAGVKSVKIKNLDTGTNYVTVIFASADIASNKQRIYAGETLELCDVLYSGTNTLTSSSGSQTCLLTILGS